MSSRSATFSSAPARRCSSSSRCMAASFPACFDQRPGPRARLAPRRRGASRLGLQPRMADATQKALGAVLEELCQAVAADGGASLYLDDGEGSLELVAFTGACGRRPPTLLDRLWDESHDKRSLVLSIPGATPGVVVLCRKTGGSFTQQDR